MFFHHHLHNLLKYHFYHQRNQNLLSKLFTNPVTKLPQASAKAKNAFHLAHQGQLTALSENVFSIGLFWLKAG